MDCHCADYVSKDRNNFYARAGRTISQRRIYRRKGTIDNSTLRALIYYIITIHCLLLFCEARQSRHFLYHWKTDPWRECVSKECGQVGVQSRHVYCVYGEQNSKASQSKCNSSTKPNHRQDCVKECKSGEFLYYNRRSKSRRNLLAEWETGVWGDCEKEGCGEGGMQRRAVNCVYVGRRMTVVHSHCNVTAKPDNERSCFKVCEEHRDAYVWDVSDWEECVQVGTRPATDREQDQCGTDDISIGLQRRNVLCVDASNSSITMDDYICESFNSPPARSRPCDIPCPINCATSEWGSWSACSRTCGKGMQHRDRSVLTTAKYGGQDCPDLSMTRPCPRTVPCDPILEEFFPHIFKFGNWTRCAPVRLKIGRMGRNHHWNRKENRNKVDQVDKSLVGGRRRNISCFDDGILLGDRIAIEETCLIPRQCQVTDWSDWSVCLSECGVRGNRTRTRDVSVLPTGPGVAECPHLEEIEECGVPDESQNCHEYIWVTGGWEECSTLSAHNASCGGGIQNRFVYCVVRNNFTIVKASTAVAKGGDDRLREWAKMLPVDEEFCDEEYKPTTWRECEVTCSSMCEVGQWSDWSECAPEVCDDDSENRENPAASRRKKKSMSGFKIREREILFSINGEDGCPHRKEFIPCEESRCYRWEVASLSACRVREGKCGPGDQILSIVCKDKWGQNVSDELCRKKPAAPLLNLTMPCYVACSSDCVVGEWSEWTPCTNDCKRGRRDSGQTTRMKRPVPQERYREILASPGPNGKPCPAVSELKELKPCNQHKCSVYYWDIGSWSECLGKNSVTPSPSALGIHSRDMFMSDDGNSSHHQPLYFPYEEHQPVCEKGYQTRTVKCKKKGSDKVKDSLCGKHRPAINRDCTLPCSKDCVVSHWGEWSSCDLECNKAIEKGGVPGQVYQKRQRVVIQHRTGKGEPCPLETTERRMCTGSERCSNFRWHTTEWSECAKVAGTNSIFGKIPAHKDLKCLGAMTRQVLCQRVGSGGQLTPAKFRLCFKYAGNPPEAARRCLLRCNQDRNFKNWKERNQCRATLRNLESMEDIHGVPVVRYNNDSYVSLQKTAKPVGEWSSCNITKPNSSPMSSLRKQSSEPYCGIGVRHRALACYIEGTDIVVDNSHCQYAEFQEDGCEIPCPEDCEMSSWLSWGGCGDRHNRAAENAAFQPPCGMNLQTRHRYRVKDASRGGRICPAVDSLTLEYDTKLCENVCDVLFWVASPWTTCSVGESGDFSNCGSGHQLRSHVECYKTDYDSGYTDVARVQSDMRSCDMTVMPFGYRKTHCACPGECVYSEWSEWGNCEAANNTDICSGRRQRTRKVLRQVAPATRLPDSHCDNPRKTIEEEPCQLNENCFLYSTMWTEWTSCKLPAGAECGTGVKMRKSNCISSTGLPVRQHKCLENGVSIPLPEHAECRVMCAIDCEVSQWSDWSVCSVECNTPSQRRRYRKITKQPNMMGRSCPVTEERSPCLSNPCHSWMLGDWSECSVPGGNCGIGLKTREVKCIQSDGVIVGSSLCESEHGDLDGWFRDSDLRRDCEIPCSGECVTTEWSEWSDCHLQCVNESTPVAGTKYGMQTRSRVGFMPGQLIAEDCPKNEIEERRCKVDDGRCFFYKWRTTPTFANGRRPVWCQRTIDNLNVSAGCTDRLKLQEELYCAQNCQTIEHAFCALSGLCECDKPYMASRRTTGTLLACKKPPLNDDSGNVRVINVGSTTKLLKISTSVETTTMTVKKADGFLDNLGIFTETGSLQPWVYGAIAGIIIFLIFIIASVYLMCVACRKKKKNQAYGPYSTKNHKLRHKRRHNSSGSNVGVGMVIGSARFPPSNSALSHTSSTSRSGFSYRDHEDILWKET